MFLLLCGSCSYLLSPHQCSWSHGGRLGARGHTRHPGDQSLKLPRVHAGRLHRSHPRLTTQARHKPRNNLRDHIPITRPPETTTALAGPSHTTNSLRNIYRLVTEQQNLESHISSPPGRHVNNQPPTTTQSTVNQPQLADSQTNIRGPNHHNQTPYSLGSPLFSWEPPILLGTPYQPPNTRPESNTTRRNNGEALAASSWLSRNMCVPFSRHHPACFSHWPPSLSWRTVPSPAAVSSSGRTSSYSYALLTALELCDSTFDVLDGFAQVDDSTIRCAFASVPGEVLGCVPQEWVVWEECV